MSDSDPTQTSPRFVLVTGPAGAGRSTGINALEDLGFETIDNLPLSLVPRLFAGPPLSRPLALGIDPRNRDFSVSAFLEMLSELGGANAPAPEILYVDCAPDVLLRRYSETRRRHPMAPNTAPRDGIMREIDLLRPIRARADYLIDTSDMSVHDLKAEITRWFGCPEKETLSVSVESFSYKRGLPKACDIVLDCRFLRNPHWDPALRPLDGRDRAVQSYVKSDDSYQPFFSKTLDMLLFLLPAYRAEGKAHLTVGFGCTGGKHRSVTLAEEIAKALEAAGWRVSTRHREQEIRAAVTAERVGK